MTEKQIKRHKLPPDPTGNVGHSIDLFRLPRQNGQPAFVEVHVEAQGWSTSCSR